MIGQKAIHEKTNEITAIPELLEQLNIEGATVSIDAIGCQKEIANKIILKGGDYQLALKGNQSSLLSDVMSLFDAKRTYFPDVFEECNKGYGRVEVRKCEVLSNIEWLQKRHPAWKKLKNVVKITSMRDIKGQATTETRYYISSWISNAKEHLDKTRQHWAIENNLHWTLDVVLKEDNSHIRVKNAAENMGTIRKMVFNLIKRYKSKIASEVGVSGLRHDAMWDEQVALEILKGLVV